VEVAEHLGYEKGDRPAARVGNNGNGATTKTVLTDSGPVTVTARRDRNGTFEKTMAPSTPAACRSNEQILSLHASGMSVRDVRRT
jgi:putative transposase